MKDKIYTYKLFPARTEFYSILWFPSFGGSRRGLHKVSFKGLRGEKLKFVVYALTVLFLMVGCRGSKKSSSQSQSMIEITDMAGRKVMIPEAVHSIFGADMTVTFFLEALAPELLIGRNMKPSAAEISVMPQQQLDLPVLGMIFYGKSTINIEKLARQKPDILFCPLFKHTTPSYIADFENYGEKIGAAVVMIDLDLKRLPEAFRFAGKLLGKTEDAEKLTAYCQETLGWADSVRTVIRDTVSIYVAEGKDGLHTIPAGSTHSQTFRVAGVKNCADVDEYYGYKEMSISMEQVLAWNPDYILVNIRMSPDEQNEMTDRMKHDRAWQSLDAVKKKHILVVPTIPHNWIDRPPGINRLIGIRWLASTLYPEIAGQNMEKEVIRFFSLFYHVQLSAKQAETLLKTN